MRVCPKCGFIDPPEWRHSKYSYWIDFCEVEHFREMHPTLLENLLKGAKIVEDSNYVYRLTKNKAKVERKALVDYGYQWSVPMEHPTRWSGVYPDFDKKWNRDPKQTVLTQNNTNTAKCFSQPTPEKEVTKKQ